MKLVYSKIKRNQVKILLNIVSENKYDWNSTLNKLKNS